MSNIKKNLGHVTAYAYYKAGGGTMTEEEFTEYMADFGDAAERAVDAASEAAQSKADAQTAATSATNSAAAALTSEENANGAMMSAYSDANRADTAADTATSAKTDAVSAKNAAQSAKTAAETAASTATTKASEAAASATTASTAASTATTKAGEAATSATNAAASAQSVASSAAQITQNAEDIDALKEDLTDVQNDLAQYEDIFTGDVDESVQNWLDAHPEATTTVEDGSLTYKKLVNGTLGFVTPEMFGAKGDGTTDDIIPLQNAINFAFENCIPVHLLGKNYLISKPLIVWARQNHAPVRKNIIGGTKLIGEGIGKTYLTKSSDTTSGITGQDVNCIIQVVDQRYRDSSFSESDAPQACYNVEIAGISLQNTSTDVTIPVTTYGIFSVGWFFSLFKDISIVGCITGMATRKWNCETRYINIDISYAQVGFDFALSPNGSGGQTTMYFESCHTNGCTNRAYSLLANATLVNCANDGGTATFIYAPASPAIRDRQGIKATVIDCHCESLIANGLFDIRDGHVSVIGGYYEIPDNNDSTLFKVEKQARLNIRDAYIISRNSKTNISNTLYDVKAFGTLHFYNCYLNNAIFSTPQPLKKDEKIIFDSGVNNVENVITSHTDSTCVVTIGDVIDVDIDGATPGGERTAWLYLGEIDTNAYNTMRIIAEGTFADNYCDCVALFASALDANGKPASYTNATMALNSNYEAVACNSNNFTAISKNELLGTKLSNLGKKHVFIRYYTLQGVIDMSIFKIWFE